MSVLATPLSLGDPRYGRIEDVEALCRKVAKDRTTQWGARLAEEKREELVSYLISVCWELSRRYDPKKDKHPNLAAYAAKILTLRVADWYRQTFGDTRHGERPIVLSLDAPIALNASEEDEGADRLVDTLVSGSGDPAEDRSPDLVGVLHGGSGPGSRAHAEMGEQATGGAARGDRSSAAGVKPVRSKKQPRVPTPVDPATGQKRRRPPSRPPVCDHCFQTFYSAFMKVNEKTPMEKRLSQQQIMEKAMNRSKAIRLGSEWACPRCTKLEDEDGQEILLGTAYPNRDYRRRAVKAAKKARKKNEQAVVPDQAQEGS